MSKNLEKLVEEGFLSIPLCPKTMLTYTVRTSILESIKEECADFCRTVLAF
jgi:hypothetical protein